MSLPVTSSVTRDELTSIGPERYCFANCTVHTPRCARQDSTARPMASESSVFPSPTAPNASGDVRYGVVAYAAAMAGSQQSKSARRAGLLTTMFSVYVVPLFLKSLQQQSWLGSSLTFGSFWIFFYFNSDSPPYYY